MKKVLLGYEEKFNKYPLINYNLNKKYVNLFNKMMTSYVTKEYVKMYKYIEMKFKNNKCIIHNDISINNIINKNNKIYLIDFDFCIESYEIVDIADAILTGYTTINQISDNFQKFKDDIIYYCNVYKDINKININYYDIMCQIAIKIISFYYYILLNNTNKKEFNKGIRKVYKLVKAVQNEYKN